MEEIKSSYPGIQKLIDSYNEPVYIVNYVKQENWFCGIRFTKTKNRITNNRKLAEKILLEEANMVLKNVEFRFSFNLWSASHMGLEGPHQLELNTGKCGVCNCELNHEVFKYMEIVDDKEYDNIDEFDLSKHKPPKKYFKIKENCPYEILKEIIEKLVEPKIILNIQEVSFE